MLKINGNKISLTRGDTAYLKIGILDGDERLYQPHEGDMVVFSVKRNIEDKEYAFQKKAKVGEVISILPTDTQDLPHGRYWYDIQLSTSLGEIFTVIDKSMFCLGEEVSK